MCILWTKETAVPLKLHKDGSTHRSAAPALLTSPARVQQLLQQSWLVAAAIRKGSGVLLLIDHLGQKIYNFNKHLETCLQDLAGM